MNKALIIAVLLPGVALGQINIPADVDTTTTPIVLSVADTTYVLASGFVAGGRAFTITANNVTLDLNGQSVYFDWDRAGSGGEYEALGYDRVCGAYIDGVDNVRITGGTIAQRDTGGQWVEGIYMDASTGNVQIDSMTININGDDGYGIWSRSASISPNFFDNTFNVTSSAVTNRHHLNAVIKIEGLSPLNDLGHGYITGNVINGGAQGGIVVNPGIATQADQSDTLYIQDNEIYHNSSYTNGFGIHFYNTVVAVVSGNTITPTNGRGISLELGEAASSQPGNFIRVNNNAVSVIERLNSEYGTSALTAYGLKLERIDDVEIFGNTFKATALHANADPDYGNAAACSITLYGSGSNYYSDNVYIHDNTFEADHDGGAATSSVNYADFATALHFVIHGTTDLRFEDNLIKSNHLFTYMAWDSMQEPYNLNGCTFEKTAGTPAAKAHQFAYWANVGSSVSGSMVLDPTETNNPSMDGYSVHASAQAWDFGTYWSTTVNVSSAGSPVSGASVYAKDTSGVTRDSTVTNGSGVAVLYLPEWIQDSTPTLTSMNNYTVYAFSAGDTASTAHVADATDSVILSLTGGSLTAPTNLTASKAP